MYHKSNWTDKPWSVGNVNIEIFEKKVTIVKKLAIDGDRLPA